MRHQIVHSNLFGILKEIFDVKKCRVFSAPFDVTFMEESSKAADVLQPYLFVSCDWTEKRYSNDRYEGIPSLGIEIMSETTRTRDMVHEL